MSVFNIPVSMECAFLDREEEFHIAKVPFTDLDGQLVTVFMIINTRLRNGSRDCSTAYIFEADD